jgi:predicted CXXCH cytochrome family protein
MRYRNLVLLIGAAAALLFIGIRAHAAISGSAHDFSAKAWNPGGQICQVCHTPHNAMTSVSNAPLWNHTVTTATFTLYTGPGTLNATDLSQPAGVSKLCLSCHDGTVGLEAFGGASGTTYITGAALLGTNLSNDHPISFTYNTALATTDGQLANPSTATSGLGGTIQNDMLFSNKLECASCHDVHNGASLAKLLLKSNAASALCLTCHLK